MSKKDVPEIRFKGFKDKWEEKKLGDLITITTGKLDANAMKADGDYDFYTSGIQKYKIDIPAFTGPAITIAGNGATVGYMHLADGMFNAYQRTYVLTNFAINRYFIFVSIGNVLPLKIKQEARTGNIPYIVLDMLTDLSIYIPKEKEQIKIGSYFQKIDKLINLHQKKYDKLAALKKAMLEKMFPKDGADVPEIRFKGFTGKWEEKKAEWIFKTITDKGHPELPVLSASQELGMIIREESGINIHHDLNNEVGYKRVLPGQFVIHLRSFQGGFAHSIKEGITSPAYTVLGFQNQSEHYDFFWKYVFNSEWFIKSLELITYGIRDGRSINYKDFSSFSFKYPSQLEQQKIGIYFQHLDKLISFQQKELDKLKNIKKACLEKMFV